MELYDDSQAGRGSGSPVDISPAREERTFKAQLGEVVPLRGWRLQRLADAIFHNIDRELLEGGANPRDVVARRLVTQKHLQGLSDALHAQGPFALEPRPGALLAIRYADRAAFEAYGRLHARVVAAGPRSGPDAVLLREMLQALRLRMLCLDWPSIALVFEGLKRPCDTVALRKRQSRLAALVAADASCSEDWAIIDGYLKARKRSFGGSSRRIPIGPIVLAVGLLAAFGALAAAAWRHFGHTAPTVVPAPLPHESTPHSTAITPQDAPVVPQRGAVAPPTADDKQKESNEPQLWPIDQTSDAWALEQLPVPLVSPPKPISDQPWLVLRSTGRLTLAAEKGRADSQRLITASSIIDAPPEVVEAVLLDFPRYHDFMPHVDEAEQLPQVGATATLVYVRSSWPGIGPVDEVYREEGTEPVVRTNPAGISGSSMTRLEFSSALAGPLEKPGVKRLYSEDRVTWSLQAEQNGRQTHLQYERYLDLPADKWSVAQVFDLMTNDLVPMLDGLEREAVNRNHRSGHSPQEYMRNLLDHLRRLTSEEAIPGSQAASNEELAQQFDRYFDFEYIAVKLLQPRADKPTAGERGAFQEKLHALMLAGIFLDAADFFQQRKVEFLPHKRVDGVITTSIHVTDDVDGTDTIVGFQWKSVGGVPKIIDVLLDGDSLVKDYQNQVARIVDKKGVAGLMQTLDERIAAAEAAHMK